MKKKKAEHKGCDEEEYALSLNREGGCPHGDAERPSEGRNAEGSFQAGGLKGGEHVALGRQ